MRKKKQVARRTKAGQKESSANTPAAKRRARYLPEDLAWMYKPVKKPVTLRLDADVLAWFQRSGRGYQTRINQTLRKVMAAERK